MKINYILLCQILVNHCLQAEFIPQMLRTDASLCVTHARQHERHNNIPAALLSAISKVESGRYHGPTNQTYAWPWTINVGGEGRYFATKAEAVNYVTNLMARGVNSIDVGCMQVNLRHHPHAFHNIDAAFDPKINTEYAARYLTNLKNNLGSWHKAVAYYHSAHAIHHNPYRQKVYAAWSKEKNYKFLTTAMSDLSPQDQYTVSYGAHGKLYKKVRLNAGPAWQLDDVRSTLSKYKSRAVKTLIEHQRHDKVIACQNIKHEQPVNKRIRSNLTSRLIQRSRQLQPSVINNHKNNSH